MDYPVEFRGLRKMYRSRTGPPQEALKGLSFHVEPGQIFGFVGPNGAGKSTAIKILVGLVRASAGEALVFGHPCGTVEARRCLGFLPEVASYHEYMTADELLRIHAHLAGVPGREHDERCGWALELVGLGVRRKSRIREFSKGMKQRFGIAQALVGRPRLLILDELTSGLDPVAQRELRTILLDLKTQDITIFFSSHQMSEVESVCDAVAFIHKGELRRFGPVRELVEGSGRVRMRFREASGEETLADLPKEETGALIDALRGRGGELVEMRPLRKALDQVFHEVVTEEVPA